MPTIIHPSTREPEEGEIIEICFACNQSGHHIRNCVSLDLRELIEQHDQQSEHSIMLKELPTYDHSHYIRWLYHISDHELKMLNSYVLDKTDEAGRNIRIARLALEQSRRFPYKTTRMIYNHSGVNIPDIDKIQKQMMDYLWSNIEHCGMEYDESNTLALERGFREFKEILCRNDYMFTIIPRHSPSPTQEMAETINSDLNLQNLRFNEPEIPLYDPDTNYIYRYMGYGITYEFIESVCPDIRELRIDALQYILDLRTGALHMYMPDSDEEDEGEDQLSDIVFETRATIQALDPIPECCLCLDCPTDTLLNCNHAYCGQCIYKLLDSVKRTNRRIVSCPICRTQITLVRLKDSETKDKMTSEFSRR
jgi:hypothetical protein